MAEISQAVPGYAKAIKNYLVAFNDYYQHKEIYAKKELKNLKLQVMSEVQKCIKDKNYAAAIAILDQLKKIVPTDLDILEITLQTHTLLIVIFSLSLNGCSMQTLAFILKIIGNNLLY